MAPQATNNARPADRPYLRVYYNSACPVCNAGVERQKRIMAGCPVAWRDVHTDEAAREEIPSDIEFVRERLHAVDERGRLNVGFDAFLTIWRHSPGEGWKARLFGLPGVSQCARLGYNVFARGLYRWNRRRGRW